MPRLLQYSLVSSTQEVAMRLAREGAPNGTTVVAEVQTDGRGSRGRAWASPKGGLYLSVVLHPDPIGFPFLSLAAGYELRQALAPHLKHELLLKWPNDLLLTQPSPEAPPRKVGGVLVDIVVRPGIAAFAVLGVGLNISGRLSDLPPELLRHAGFLHEASKEALRPSELVELVLGAVDRASARVSSSDGRRTLPDLLSPHLYGVGRAVRADALQGTFRGVGGEGEALVEVGPGEVRSLRAGDLSLEVL